MKYGDFSLIFRSSPRRLLAEIYGFAYPELGGGRGVCCILSNSLRLTVMVVVLGLMKCFGVTCLSRVNQKCEALYFTRSHLDKLTFEQKNPKVHNRIAL